MRERSSVRSLDGVIKRSASVTPLYAAIFCSKSFSAYRSLRARRRKISASTAESEPPKKPPINALQLISIAPQLYAIPFPHVNLGGDPMPLYLIHYINSTDTAPRIMFGATGDDACRLAGLDPALCVIKDITRRALQPHQINNAPLTPEFFDDAREKED